MTYKYKLSLNPFLYLITIARTIWYIILDLKDRITGKKTVVWIGGRRVSYKEMQKHARPIYVKNKGKKNEEKTYYVPLDKVLK